MMLVEGEIQHRASPSAHPLNQPPATEASPRLCGTFDATSVGSRLVLVLGLGVNFMREIPVSSRTLR